MRNSFSKYEQVKQSHPSVALVAYTNCFGCAMWWISELCIYRMSSNSRDKLQVSFQSRIMNFRTRRGSVRSNCYWLQSRDAVEMKRPCDPSAGGVILLWLMLVKAIDVTELKDSVCASASYLFAFISARVFVSASCVLWPAFVRNRKDLCEWLCGPCSEMLQCGAWGDQRQTVFLAVCFPILSFCAAI